MSTENVLSPTMIVALDAIVAGGGECHPLPGGYWGSTPTADPIRFEPPPGTNLRILVTQTVVALAARGRLVKIPCDRPRYRSAYRVAAEAHRDEE